MSDEQTPYRFACNICGRQWLDGKEVDSRLLESRQMLKKEDGAGLIHQTIPDVEGTEPRLNGDCEDCGKPYPFGIDLVLSDADWLMIHPSGDGGLLCAGCIAQRVAALPTSIIIFSRIVTKENHEAFTFIKNVAIESLSAAAQLSLDEIRALKASIDDIRDGRIVSFDRFGSGHSASPEHSVATNRSAAKEDGLLESQTIDQWQEDESLMERVANSMPVLFRHGHNEMSFREREFGRALIAAVRRSGEPT